MTTPVTEHASIWLDDAGPSYPALTGDLDVDVVVVGAGITGLTTARLLQQDGTRVAVVDMHRVATGTTGHTTGKVTSQHGLTYAKLASRHGDERARSYGEANEAGVQMVARLSADAGADCALTRAPAYVYTARPASIGRIEEEAAVAARLGLPARLAAPDEVPIDGALAAVRFDDQLHFDAVAYCQALAAAVATGGGSVHEHTRATAVRERGGRVVVETPGGRIRADHAVVATLLPFLDSTGAFVRARASRAYGLAARVADPERVGMFITADRPTRSTRPWLHDGGIGVVVVGEEHDTGTETATGRHYRALEDWARTTFDVTSIERTWSAQDYTTLDDVPYVGRVPLHRRTWYATGYRKWGLSNATAASMVLRDLIAGRQHPWAALFDPGRIGGVHAAGRFLLDNAKVARHLAGGWAGRLHASSVDDLAPGDGGVVRHRGLPVGAYRDERGELHGVGLTCTHLGCTVRWNAAETTWDCPCHGSRFDHHGTVLQGPAVRDLPRRDLT